MHQLRMELHLSIFFSFFSSCRRVAEIRVCCECATALTSHTAGSAAACTTLTMEIFFFFFWADDKVGVVFLTANVSFSLSAGLLAKSACLGKKKKLADVWENK